MSLVKLFASDRLIQLYKEGKLRAVMDTLDKKISEKTFLYAGVNVSIFSYKNDKQVLMFCPMTIPYFKRYGHVGAQMGLTPGQQFKEHINSLGVFFLPIKEIIYEDANVFVYVQDNCQRVKKNITPLIVAEFLQLIQFMIKKNVLLTDLSPNNVSVLNGHLIISDYHGLHPLKREGRIHREKWWGRLFRNLVRFISHIYAPEKLSEYSELLNTYNATVAEKLAADKQLPPAFIELIKYVSTNENTVDLTVMYKLLSACIETVCKGFKFDTKQSQSIKTVQAKLDKYNFH